MPRRRARRGRERSGRHAPGSPAHRRDHAGAVLLHRPGPRARQAHRDRSFERLGRAQRPGTRCSHPGEPSAGRTGEALAGEGLQLTKEAVPAPYSWSISMFCFVPLLAMETIIPRPARITTPITIQVVSMVCRMPSFQNPARTPPMSKANPKKYLAAHFLAHLLIGDGLLSYWTLPGRGQFHADNRM